MRKLVLLFSALCAVGSAQHRLDFSKLEVKAVKVSGSVYLLDTAGPGFSGGNVGASVGEDGIVIIDDKFAPLGPKIEAALKSVTDKPIRFVINTHIHADHTHGNIHFGGKSTIIAHENVRKRLPDYKEFGGPNSPPPPQVYPIITYHGRVSIHLNGEDVKGIHFPSSHTDGDTVVFFTQSNVVHMGDNFFHGMFPYFDLQTGGSVKGYIRTTEAVLQQIKPDTKIISGHGPLATVEDLKANLAMLKETAAIIERVIKAGKTADQLKKEKALAKYEKYSGTSSPLTNTSTRCTKT
jgi:cyclase